jgi:hypothetical protein
MLRSLRGHYADALTSASYLSLFAFALHANDKRIWLIAMSLVAVISFFIWSSTFKRARTIADIATSRIASAAQGYVELYGRASVDAENLIASPLSGMQCIWFRYWVYSKENSDREWREISSGVSDRTFEINDGTGKSVVDPDDAEIIAPDRRVTYLNGYKHVEELLYAGSIYVLGEFSTIGGANSPLSVKEDVNFLLAEWKKDPINLKKRFDLNGDGAVDLQEWELARRQAIREVEKQHREIRSQTGVHIMRAPRDSRLFLISSLSPQKLRQRYILWSFFHISVCFASVGAIFKFAF